MAAQTGAIAPAGFRVRPPVMADLEAVQALGTALEIADTGTAQSASTLDEFRAGWTAPGFDLQRDAWVVCTKAGHLVAYIEVRELNGAFVESDGYVHPDFQRRGIGTLLLRLAEARARSVTPTLPPDQRRVLTGGITASNQDAVRLFEGLGFRAVRYFIRETITFSEPPPEPQWPAGVTVRTLRNDAEIATVFCVVEEAFRDHWGEREPTLQEWTHRWREGGLDPRLWLIAESGDTIAGVSLCRLRQGTGHVHTLGVLRPYRRTGLGLALLRQSFAEFYRRGVTTVDLGVDAESLTGATRLYQRAGMHEASRFAVYSKDL